MKHSPGVAHHIGTFLLFAAAILLLITTISTPIIGDIAILKIDGTQFSTAGGDTANALTKVMILHPIACGLAFIAFLLAIGSGFCGSLLAAMVAAVTWLITLVEMATDFAAFGIIKNNVNNDGTGSHANYSVGMWTILAAMICLLFATILVVFSCCSSRRSRCRSGKLEPAYSNGGVATATR